MKTLPAAYHHKQHYDDAVRQRAFLLWMWECDADIPKTERALIAQEEADAALAQREPAKMPDQDTLRRWKAEQDWPAMRHEILLADDTAGALYNHAIGQHLLLLHKAASRHAAVLDLPLTEPIRNREGNIIGQRPSPALPTIYKAIEGVYAVARLINVGRGEGDPAPKLTPSPTPRLGDGPRTPEQIQRERMARTRAAKRPTRGKS